MIHTYITGLDDLFFPFSLSFLCNKTLWSLLFCIFGFYSRVQGPSRIDISYFVPFFFPLWGFLYYVVSFSLTLSSDFLVFYSFFFFFQCPMILIVIDISGHGSLFIAVRGPWSSGTPRMVLLYTVYVFLITVYRFLVFN